MSTSEHWNRAWMDRDPATTSWFEAERPFSAEVILDGAVPESVVDIGAGASTLVDHLLAAGVGHVTLLDIAAEPLQVTHDRLGERPEVEYVVTSVLDWEPRRRYVCWHDRAAFHFLTESADQDAYADRAAGAVEPGGRLIVATFASDGPEKCSGLVVARRDPTSLAAAFAPAFELQRTVDHVHHTPHDAVQPFLYGIFLRTDPT